MVSLSFETEQEMNAKELSITKLQSENKIAALTKYFSFGIAALVLALAGVIYYRFKSKQKANIKLEKTLLELQTTTKAVNPVGENGFARRTHRWHCA